MHQVYTPIENDGGWPRQTSGVLNVQICLHQKKCFQKCGSDRKGEIKQYLLSGDTLIIPSAVDFLGREIISDSLWKILFEEGLRTDDDTQGLNPFHKTNKRTSKHPPANPHNSRTAPNTQ